MKTILFAGALAIAGATLMAAPAGTADKPNFILFLIDDQNIEQVGAYGGKVYTPNLDRMAAEGMKFTQAHVSTTVCTPSRYAWLTGRYAGNSYSKVYQEACGGPGMQGYPNFNVALEHDRMNIGRVMSDAGYVTGFTGKFHVFAEQDWPEFFGGADGFVDIPRKGLKPGPEASALFLRNDLAMRRYLNALGFTWAGNIYPENLQNPYNHHNPEWTVSAAFEFLEQNRDKPFYLHITPTLLHGGDGSWKKSMDYPLFSGDGDLKELPRVMTPRAELLKKLKAAGFDPENAEIDGIAWIDDAIGAVLGKLKELGIDRKTFIIYCPDHGREGKGSLFDHNGTHIPMIARWPDRIPAGSVCDELVQNIDWAPTVFDLGGATIPEGYKIDGRSWAPLLATGTASPWRDHLYFEIGNARGVGAKDWRYIAVRYPKDLIEQIKKSPKDKLPRLMSYKGGLGIATRGAAKPGFWDADQLYDIQADPDEMNNIAGAQPERFQQMQSMMTNEIKAIGRPFGEFLPGGNAVPNGQIDAQITAVKTLKIDGKTVTDPEAGAQEPGKSEKPTPADKEARKKAAEERLKRKARKAAGQGGTEVPE